MAQWAVVVVVVGGRWGGREEAHRLIWAVPRLRWAYNPSKHLLARIG